MSSSDMSPMRFCVRVSVITPGSLLGSSSENAVFSCSCEARRAEAPAIASAPHQDQHRVSGDPAVVTADTTVRGGRHPRRTYQAFHRRGIVGTAAKLRSIGQSQARRTRVYMYVREVSSGDLLFTNGVPTDILSMASLRLARAAERLAIALIAIGIAISGPTGLRGRRRDHRCPGARQPAHGGVDRPFDRRGHHRRHAGGGHARPRARAAQHRGPVRRRQRLVGAARRRRAGQHLGQGQVPLGAGPHRLLVREQQVDRLAVRARQPVRARQAAVARGRLAHDRLGRGPRLPRSRRCSAAGSTGSCRASCSGRSSPSTRTPA